MKTKWEMQHERLLDDIISRADLVAVIKRRVALRKGGNLLVGRCPSCEVARGEIVVYPKRHFYRCGLCDRIGDAITFTQKYVAGKSTLKDAVTYVARDADVDLSSLNDMDWNTITRLRTRGDILTDAAYLYYRSLLDGRCENRGRLGGEAIVKALMIGSQTFSVAETLLHPNRGGYSEKDCAATGLWTRSNDCLRRMVFALSQCVTYPYWRRGRCVGMTGYYKTQDGPKQEWLSGSESLIYNADALRRKNVCLTSGVRTCVDMIATGLPAVALRFEAFTRDHVSAFSSCERVCICLSGTASPEPETAAMAVAALLGSKARILRVPEEYRIATYVRQDADAFKALAAEAPTPVDYLLARVPKDIEQADLLSRLGPVASMLATCSPTEQEATLHRVKEVYGFPGSLVDGLRKQIRVSKHARTWGESLGKEVPDDYWK